MSFSKRAQQHSARISEANYLCCKPAQLCSAWISDSLCQWHPGLSVDLDGSTQALQRVRAGHCFSLSNTSMLATLIHLSTLSYAFLFSLSNTSMLAALIHLSTLSDAFLFSLSNTSMLAALIHLSTLSNAFLSSLCITSMLTALMRLSTLSNACKFPALPHLSAHSAASTHCGGWRMAAA